MLSFLRKKNKTESGSQIRINMSSIFRNELNINPPKSNVI